LGFPPLPYRIIGFDAKLQPLSSIIVGNFHEFQAGSICPRMAKGSPKAGQRELKGIPKGTTVAQRPPKGSPRAAKRVKMEPKVGPGAAKYFPKTPKGSQSERYISQNSPSATQADVTLQRVGRRTDYYLEPAPHNFYQPREVCPFKALGEATQTTHTEGGREGGGNI